ncbi:UNVERIFIED_ORG: hypothetical protein ABIB52_004243 [Arthrobacter sp. UYCu721]
MPHFTTGIRPQALSPQVLPEGGQDGRSAIVERGEDLAVGQVARVLKINELETITDYVIEAAASILVIGN